MTLTYHFFALLTNYEGVSVSVLIGREGATALRAPGRCAQAIRVAVRPIGLEIRAGLHTGEVETINGKVGGVTVSVGARVLAKASASEVLVSQTVKGLVAGAGLTFEYAGEHELKGVPDRWHLYRVVK